jgi:hypothetical protein
LAGRNPRLAGRGHNPAFGSHRDLAAVATGYGIQLGLKALNPFLDRNYAP